MERIDIANLDTLNQDTVLCLGFFDGVHRGHQKIIAEAVKLSKRLGIPSALYTFKQHPLEVIHQGLCFPYINTLSEKMHLVKKEGISKFILASFTLSFSTTKPEDFVEKILIEKLRGKFLVVGEDYRFGYRSRGDVDLLRKIAKGYRVGVKVVPKVSFEGRKISSTDIRESILAGEVKRANYLLGRWYSIEATVKEGKKRGRKLGIPTANMDLPCNKVMPRAGVYCVLAQMDGKMYKGVGHIGHRPTFDEDYFTIEIHLLGFSGFLYGKKMRIFFIEHIRDTFKFESPEEMTKRIKEDIKKAEDILSKISKEDIKRNNKFLDYP